MDFSGSAGAQTKFDTIPKGQLAWVHVQYRGMKDSQSSASRYLDLELTICDGQPYAGKKLWEMVGDPTWAENSDNYKQMGTIAITRMLEAGRTQRGAGFEFEAFRAANGYTINDFGDLDNLIVPIKITEDKPEPGRDTKNRVGEWLTPNPESKSGHKGYTQLLSGVYNANPNAGAQPAGAAPAAFGAQPAPQPAPPSAPVPEVATPAANPTPPAQGAGFQPQTTQPQPPSDGSGQMALGGNAPPASPASSPSDDTPTWMQQANQTT